MAGLLLGALADSGAEDSFQRHLSSSLRASSFLLAGLLAASAASGLLLSVANSAGIRGSSGNEGAGFPVLGSCATVLLFAAGLFVQLLSNRPLKTLDLCLTAGLARATLICWNGIFWPLAGLSLPHTLTTVLASPLLSGLLAAASGKVPLVSFLKQNTASVFISWWLAQWAADPSLLPCGRWLHVTAALVVPMAFAAVAEAVSRKAFLREWHGEQPVFGSNKDHGEVVAASFGSWVQCSAAAFWRHTRRALALQPIPFTNAFMEASYQDFDPPGSLHDAPLHFYVFAASAALLLLPQSAPGWLAPGAARAVAAAAALLAVACMLGGAVLPRVLRKRQLTVPALQLLSIMALLLRLRSSAFGTANVWGVLLMLHLLLLSALALTRLGVLWPAAAAAAASAAVVIVGVPLDCVGLAITVANVALPLMVGYKREVAARWRFLGEVLWRDDAASTGQWCGLGVCTTNSTCTAHAQSCSMLCADTRGASSDDLASRLAQLDHLLRGLQSGAHRASTDSDAELCRYSRELCAFATHTVGGPEALLCLGASDRLHTLLAPGRRETALLEGLRLLLCLAGESGEVVDEVLEQGLLTAMVAAAEAAPPSSAMAVAYALAALANSHDLHAEAAAAGGVRLAAWLLDAEGGQPPLQAAGAHTLSVLLSSRAPRVMCCVLRRGLVPRLVALAAPRAPPAVRNPACSALAFATVSGYEGAQEEVVDAGGIEVLLLRLSPNDPMAATAAAALASLAASAEEFRRQIREAGGVPKLVPLLMHGTEEMRAFAICALEAVVSSRDARASADFVGSQGVVPLVGMLLRGGASEADAAAGHGGAPAMTSSSSLRLRVEAGSGLLGNLYSTTPGLRPHVLAASRRAPVLEMLMGAQANGRFLSTAAAQIMQDARLARGTRGDGIAKAA